MVNVGSYLLISEPLEILPRFNSTLSRPGRAVTPSDASTAALGQQPTVLLRTTNGSNERLTCRTLEHRLLPQLVAVSTGRRNTRVKLRRLGIWLQSSAGPSGELAQRWFLMIELTRRKAGWRRNAPAEQAIGAVTAIRLPMFPETGAGRAFESLAIPLIQKPFRYAVACRQSVASTD